MEIGVALEVGKRPESASMTLHNNFCIDSELCSFDRNGTALVGRSVSASFHLTRRPCRGCAALDSRDLIGMAKAQPSPGHRRRNSTFADYQMVP